MRHFHPSPGAPDHKCAHSLCPHPALSGPYWPWSLGGTCHLHGIYHLTGGLYLWRRNHFSLKSVDILFGDFMRKSPQLSVGSSICLLGYGRLGLKPTMSGPRYVLSCWLDLTIFRICLKTLHIKTWRHENSIAALLISYHSVIELKGVLQSWPLPGLPWLW